jgi:hypothetical protein
MGAGSTSLYRVQKFPDCSRTRLDKRPVRTAVFALVNAVEQLLLRRVVEVHGESNSWTAFLTRGQVEKIHGYFEEAKLRDMELNPVHYASLTHLILIAEGSPVIGIEFDIMLGATWAAQMRHLRDWRDRVAHAGKPLVDTPEKVPELWNACKFAEDVLGLL